jgi:hypothetical protein
MGGIKTRRTGASVDEYIESITNEVRRSDCVTLLNLMRRATRMDPELWSSGAVGFGTFHYKTASGQEGEWFPVGFASRKAAITVYLGVSLEGSAGLLEKLGTYTTGAGCIYVKKLADVDLAVLEEVVAGAYAHIKATYG